jgi:hypothetical protein
MVARVYTSDEQLKPADTDINWIEKSYKGKI